MLLLGACVKLWIQLDPYNKVWNYILPTSLALQGKLISHPLAIILSDYGKWRAGATEDKIKASMAENV